MKHFIISLQTKAQMGLHKNLKLEKNAIFYIIYSARRAAEATS
jgi:hypothetical protein